MIQSMLQQTVVLLGNVKVLQLLIVTFGLMIYILLIRSMVVQLDMEELQQIMVLS